MNIFFNRSLADACGACGDSDCIIDLLVYMDDQGLLPDHQMLHAVVRALAANPPPPPSAQSSSQSASSDSASTQSVGKTPETAPVPTSTTRRIYSLFRGSAPVAQPPVTPAPPSTAGDSIVASANTTERRDRAESVVGSLTLPTKLRNKVISPIEVWTFTDWRSLQRGQSSLVSRRTPTVTTENAANESRVTKLLFGPSPVAQDGSLNRPPPAAPVSASGVSSHSGATHSSGGGEKEPASSSSSSSASSYLYSLPSAAVHAVVSVPSVALHTVVSVPGVALHTVASVLSPSVSHPSSNASTAHSNSSSSGQPLQIAATAASMAYSDNSFRWSSSVLSDGMVPKLQWSDLGSPTRHPIYFASKKLHRHMRICEKKLMECFPELSIELESPFGTLCPNKKCSIRRPLTMGEIHQGWIETAGKFTDCWIGCPLIMLCR